MSAPGRSVAPEPSLASSPALEGPVVSPAKRSRPSRSRTSCSAPHKYGHDPKPVAERAESPDPIGLSPGEDLEVKREALEEFQAGAEDKVPHPRFYTEAEVSCLFQILEIKLIKQLAVILNTLGPDPKSWSKTKAKSEEICKNLRQAGYPNRSVGAMNVKYVLRVSVGIAVSRLTCRVRLLIKENAS